MSNVKKKYIILIFIGILLILSIIFPISVRKKYRLNGKGYVALDLVENEYEFSINSQGKNFNEFGIRLGTYGIEEQQGIIEIKLLDDEKIITKKDIAINDINDNQYIPITFKKEKKSKGKDYVLHISIKNRGKNDRVGLWLTEMEDNNNPVDYYTYGESANKYMIWYCATSMVIYYTYLVLNKENWR